MRIDGRKRLISLAVVMSAIALIVVGTTTYALYQSALEQQRAHLASTVRSQVRLIEAVARYDLEDRRTQIGQQSVDRQFDAEKHLEGSLQQFQGFGETCEITIAQLQGDQIVLLHGIRLSSLDSAGPIPLDSRYAEPMRLALSGKSGTLIGLDYRGEQVLSAYESVSGLNLGVVAKIDLAEIRAPFIRTAVVNLALILVCIGSMFYIVVNNPMVKKLTESEEYLRKVIASSPDAITVCDLTGLIIDCNEQTARMHGYSSRDEILGVNAWTLFHPDALPTARANLELVGQGESARDVELMMLRQDGSSFPAEMSMSPIKDGNGQPVSLVGITKDISKRKEIEAKSEERRKQLDSLLANVDAIILEGNPYDIYYVGGRVKELLGYPVEDWFNHSEGPAGFWSSLLYPDDKDKFRICAEAIARGESHSFEYRMIAADGRIVWFFDSVSVETEEGVPVKARSLMIDITQRKRAEQALIDSEHRLTSHLQNTPVVAIEWNLDFEVTEWNRAAEKVFGYSKAEALGRHAAGLIVPESARDHVNTVWTDLLQNKGGYHSTNENSTKEGRIIICDWNNTPLLGKDGKVCGVASLVQDITQRVRAEEALQKSEERFSDIANNMPGAVFQFVRDKNGNFSMPFVSGGLKLIAGVSARVVMHDANKVVDYVHPEDRERFLNSIKQSAESMETWDLEFRIIAPDNSEVWVKGCSNPRRLPDGQIQWNGVIVDMTERKQAEEALRDSEAKFRRITERLFDVVVTADLDSTIRYVSPSIERVFGYGPAEITGRRLTEFVPESEKTILRRTFDQTADGKLVEGVQTRFLKKGGAIVWIEVNAVPIRKDGRIVGAQSVIRDITDRKRMEIELARKEKLESIGVLAGGIAHDFNNVLTGVAGNLQLAQCDIDPESEAGLCLRDADLATSRAADLTQQLLTFAKGGAPVKKTASIKEIIEQSARFALHGSNVRCELSLQDDLLHAEIDLGQINQVINNLIINADQAMPVGGSIFLNAVNHRVDADSSLPLQPGDYICISIRDQGVGIDEDTQRRIFDPFFTTKPSGSGLGLTSTYSIVKNHGGHIDVHSTPGHGAEFRVYLPATHGTALSDPEEPDPCNNDGGRILVMDDEACVRDVASKALRRQGFEVDTVADGVEAIELFVVARAQGRPYSVVILDLTIPGGLGGIETVDQLLRIEPDLQAIVCSGYATDPILASYRDYGFQAIIGKPFRPRDLIRTVNLLASRCAQT